ncbi:MAG: cell envelope integrity protein CreD [Bacteroidetes bacterium]|nr:cell envelope integrity protein CreD [Bacteroidota bacterium]
MSSAPLIPTRSIGWRLAIIIVLSLLLTIPAMMIEGLINERSHSGTEAVLEVGSKWGGRQTITGPVLTIPFTKVVMSDGKAQTVFQNLYILPESLKVNSVLKPEIRYRGIFEVVLYQSEVNLAAEFQLPNLKEHGIAPEQMLWDQAFFALGISDLKGIQDMVVIKAGDSVLTANPSVLTNSYLSSGLSAKYPVDPNKLTIPFSTRLNLNGSGEFYLVPAGKETKATVTANWGNPSFSGDFLPDSRNVTDSAFSASWKVLHLNRNFPQTWIDGDFKIEETRFGVNLLIPVDHYQKTSRTVKYAIMFIGLTFLAFFMVEIASRRRIHPVQYLLIGFALIIFYTLLLSISEHLSFNWAYWISAAAILLLIGLYAKAVLKELRSTGLITGLLLILYLFLFVILQLEDYALLIGSLGLFGVLASVMYMTRNFDWFNPDSFRGEIE